MPAESLDNVMYPLPLSTVNGHFAICQIFSDTVLIRIIIKIKNSLQSKTLIDPKRENPRNGLGLGLPLKSLQRCFHFDGGVFSSLHLYVDYAEGTEDVDIALC